MTKRSWGYVARKTVREFSDDECPDRAGSLTYYGVLALFPGLLALASLLAIVGQGQRAIDAVFRVLEPLAPTEVLDTVREPLEQFARLPRRGSASSRGSCSPSGPRRAMSARSAGP